MDELIVKLLGGNLTAETLLLLFIVGILTKRFVPWWVYEEVVEELRKYEDDAPQLLDAVQELTDEVREQGLKSPKLDAVEHHATSIRRRERDGPYSATRRRDRND
jgi:hypothetical protein